MNAQFALGCQEVKRFRYTPIVNPKHALFLDGLFLLLAVWDEGTVQYMAWCPSWSKYIDSSDLGQEKIVFWPALDTVSHQHRSGIHCSIISTKGAKKFINHWWLVRVTLVAALGFCPRILGSSRGLRIVILLEKECSLSTVDNHRWRGLSNLTSW